MIFTEPGTPIDLAHEPELAPGVQGYAIKQPDAICIPFIAAVVEGDGRVGQFLDSLPRDETVIVPNVISPRLAGMLERRGFGFEMRYSEEWGEHVPLHIRHGSAG